MEYEKKYRDLVEAVKALQEANPSDEGIQKWVEDNVPELKESEDEKIRKALMQNLKERFGTKGNMGEGLDMPDVLAWLEKQGERKHVDSYCQDAFIEKACEYFNGSLEDTKVMDDYRNILVRGIQARYTSVEEFIENFKKYIKGE